MTATSPWIWEEAHSDKEVLQDGETMISLSSVQSRLDPRRSIFQENANFHVVVLLFPKPRECTGANTQQHTHTRKQGNPSGPGMYLDPVRLRTSREFWRPLFLACPASGSKWMADAPKEQRLKGGGRPFSPFVADDSGEPFSAYHGEAEVLGNVWRSQKESCMGR